MKKIDLNAIIQDSCGEVTLDGATYKVRPISGVAFQMWSAAPPERAALVGYDVAALCIPDMPRVTIDTLAPAQISAILKLAMDSVEAVQGADPNADGPAKPSLA